MEYTQRLEELATKRQELAVRYATSRFAYGKAKAEIDIIYASKIKKINEVKKNAGYETGLLILMSTEVYLREPYKEMITQLNNYKALERIIDAHESEIMSIQSILRWNRSNDGGG